MKTKSLALCKIFLSEVLEKEEWFQNVVSSNGCDLVLLTGTAAENATDELSDIDIFLVCKLEAQKYHNLKPVQVYHSNNKVFEVSILSSEKLFSAQLNKSGIYWWRHCSIIKSYNNSASKALENASFLTTEELLDRLWTNFVRFEINSHDITKQISRKEPLSVKILFNENIKAVIDSKLANVGEFYSLKQTGRILKNIDHDLYNKIIHLQGLTDSTEISTENHKLRDELIKVLKLNGFNSKEINEWDSCNLKRIIFQYQ